VCDNKIRVAQEEMARAKAEDLKKQSRQEELKAKREAKRLELEAKRSEKKRSAVAEITPERAEVEEQPKPSPASANNSAPSSPPATPTSAASKQQQHADVSKPLAQDSASANGKVLALKPKSLELPAKVVAPTPVVTAAVEKPPVPKPTPALANPTAASTETPQEPEKDLDAELLNLLDEPRHKPAPRKVSTLAGKKPLAKKKPAKVAASSAQNEQQPMTAVGADHSSTTPQEVSAAAVVSVPVETPPVVVDSSVLGSAAPESELAEGENTKVASATPSEPVPSPLTTEAATPTDIPAAVIETTPLTSDDGWGNDNDPISQGDEEDAAPPSSQEEKPFFGIPPGAQQSNLADMITQEMQDESLALKRAKKSAFVENGEGEDLEEETNGDEEHPVSPPSFFLPTHLFTAPMFSFHLLFVVAE